MEGEWWSFPRDCRDNLARGSGCESWRRRKGGWGWVGGGGWIIRVGLGRMERWKRACRVPGDVDLSDSTAVALTATSTCRTTARSCPSFFRISLLFAKCWCHYSSITVIHSGLRHVIPYEKPHLSLPSVSRKPLEIRLGLKMANEFPIWMHTLTLSSLCHPLSLASGYSFYLSSPASSSSSTPPAPMANSDGIQSKLFTPGNKPQYKINGRKWIVSVSRLCNMTNSVCSET